MPLPSRKTVTRAHLPRGTDDLWDLVTTEHGVTEDGSETLLLVHRGGGTSTRLPAGFDERYELVEPDRLSALSSRHRTVLVRSPTDDRRPGEEGHEPPIPCLTNGTRVLGGVRVLFERDTIDGPLARLMAGGGRPVIAYVPGCDAYVWANCFGPMPDGMTIEGLVPMALAGTETLLPAGATRGEEIHLTVVPGEDVTTEDGTVRHVYPVLGNHGWRIVEPPR